MAEQEKHWGDEGVTIDEISDDEREVLLVQAGPVGEQARLAWQAYQDDRPKAEEAHAVERERVRLQEMGQIPTEPAEAVEEDLDEEDEDEDEEEAEATDADAATDPASDPERALAERQAAVLHLQIRDFGTAGDWRLYDPATGRQVAKSVLATANLAAPPVPPG